MSAITKPVLLTKHIPSSSNPAVTYVLTLFVDRTFWCTCPKFKFSRSPVASRSCKHTMNHGIGMMLLESAPLPVVTALMKKA